MRLATAALCAMLAASPAAAQNHARHTPAHDSAHAIVLTDAEHLALHQLLLGRWVGAVPVHGGAHNDTLDLRFENDSLHQQLTLRHGDDVSGFLIRGDSIQWKQPVGDSSCLATTAVSALMAATRSKESAPAQIKGIMTCGKDQSPFTLKKVGQ
jgi:hypothetical protein